MTASPPPGIPTPPGPQPDMTRAVHRAADAVAGSVAALGADLGVAREVIAVQHEMLAAKDRDLEERDRVIATQDAELARLRAANETFERRIADLTPGTDGDAGTTPDGARGGA